MTKIVVCVRARDEEKNIARFIKSYWWADQTLILDGGSLDNTKGIAHNFDKVEVRDFTEKVYGNNGLWRNPEGRHINALINWAKEYDPDWIVFDDCDSFPTKELQNDARDVFEKADAVGAMGIRAHHIYMYGKDKWLPGMNNNVGFVWAWKPKLKDMKAKESEEWGIILQNFPEPQEGILLKFPHALLHDYCPDIDTVNKKLEFYRKNGRMCYTPHPLESGPLADMESWMV
jgi:glycosyltransferase involved in cell wall biosynthesis